MTAVRKEENEEFLNAKKEDQEAIDLLMAARDALTKFYKKNKVDMGPIQGSVKGASFAQEPEFEVSADQAPDADFSGKGKRKHESKGIVQMMTMIIEDLNDEIKNGMKAEEAAQLTYEEQMKAAEALKEDLVAKKISLEEAIAKREEDKTDEEKDKSENEAELDDELKYKADIKPDCDWIIGAFTKRATARAAAAAGADASFDDRRLAKIHFLGV